MDNFMINNLTNKTSESYINNILISLFWSKPYQTTHLLEKKLSKDEKYLVQASLEYGLLNQLNENMKSVEPFFAFFKNICEIYGWKKSCNSAIDFFSFLWNLLEGKNIQINKKIKNYNTDYITLEVPDNIQKINVKSLINNWTNITQKAISHPPKRIGNIPLILPLVINRKKNENVDIDIQKSISIANVGPKKEKLTWNFLSAICKKKSLTSDIKYYTLLLKFNKWYIYDSDKSVSIDEIQMKNNPICENIKKECLIIFYALYKENEKQ